MKLFSWLKNNYREIVIVLILVVVGLYFRIKGISSNHSFWSDEAFSSSISRDILTGKMSFKEGLGILSYQRMQLISALISQKLFGFSEWSARFFSVLWGTFGIVFAYLLARKHSNKGGAILAATIFSLFQLNLAQSTQAKPFVAIETLILMVLYTFDRNIVLAIIFATFATLYNYIGIAAFFPIAIILGKELIKLKKRPLAILILVILVAAISWILQLDKILLKIFDVRYNWTTYLREIFWRQYGFITLPATFGLFLIKEKKSFLATSFLIISIAISWNFISFNNLRYLMPLFGIIIVLFGIFWGKVGQFLFNKPTLICALVLLLVFIGGNKIVRKPAVYYTPNADLAADVQNADYKTFFKKTYELFPDFNTLPVFVGPFDTLSWYTERNPTAMFSISTPKPVYVEAVKSWQYGSLDEFKAERAKYVKGLVIVNDWHSYMPEDIKAYVKKNMTLELRIESMEVSPNDKWPLELYSWGMKKLK